jgi:hypothetical protein
LAEPLQKLLSYCYKVKDVLPNDEDLVDRFIPYIDGVIAKQLNLFRQSTSYVPDFVTIDVGTLGAEFFTIGSILLQAKSTASTFPLKKTRVMGTGSFSTRSVSFVPEVSSDENDSDADIQFVKTVNFPKTISSVAKSKSGPQQKQIYCYDDQRVGGCQEENCQYCKLGKKTCIACNMRGHGASTCQDSKAQAEYFMQRIKPSAKLAHGDHPLYGGSAKILLGRGFSKKQPTEQALILKEAVKHCQDQAKKIASGNAAPERPIVYTSRQ